MVRSVFEIASQRIVGDGFGTADPYLTFLVEALVIVAIALMLGFAIVASSYVRYPR